MILYDIDTGYATLWTWGPGGVYGRSQWYWGPGWDDLIAVDGNSDGFVDDAFLSDRQTGAYWIYTWRNTIPIALNHSSFAPGWDDMVAGDLDSQGNLDELFLRDRESGTWVVVNFFTYEMSQGLARAMTSGRWLPDWDDFVTGDWDTDGRIDELFIYDQQGGGWAMLSWHRYVPGYAAISSFVPELDTFLAGSFG